MWISLWMVFPDKKSLVGELRHAKNSPSSPNAQFNNIRLRDVLKWKAGAALKTTFKVIIEAQLKGIIHDAKSVWKSKLQPWIRFFDVTFVFGHTIAKKDKHAFSAMILHTEDNENRAYTRVWKSSSRKQDILKNWRCCP